MVPSFYFKIPARVTALGTWVMLFMLSMFANPGVSQAQDACAADFGMLGSPKVCVLGDSATIQTGLAQNTVVPQGFEVLYVLTSGEGLVIEAVSNVPQFGISQPAGLFTIHTLVYDPETLDLSIVVPGQTTGFDVNELLIQGGGTVCGVLDVAGIPFEFDACEPACFAGAGTLAADSAGCLADSLVLTASQVSAPTLPDENYQQLFVLTSGEGLVIQGVSETPEFTVTDTGRFTIHSLVFDPATLDLSIVVPGETTGFDVNALLIQGGGDICGALDVAGAPFDVITCEEACVAEAGTLAVNDIDCLQDSVVLTATEDQAPNVPEGFQVLYVLTSGDSLVIQGVSETPEFTVTDTGRFTIHTLVFDPATLDLSIVVPGETTGFDVNALLFQGGGDICGALDVAGAPFDVITCEAACEAEAGTLAANDIDCLQDSVVLTATEDQAPNVPEGFQVLYVLTSGDSLVIQGVSETPEFTVTDTGRFTIHTLVYDPATLDLSIVVPGETTGFDVNALLFQGGGDICGALDVAGAPFDVITCEAACEADAGTLAANDIDCLQDSVVLTATEDQAPNVPEGFQVLYVLTSGDSLVIQGVSETPEFNVTDTGRFTIHTLVFDPATLDLSIVVPGETTGFDVNALLFQGGGDICGALDVAGAPFDVITCEAACEADAGTLAANDIDCLQDSVVLTATEDQAPNVPEGFQVLYVLTSGDSLVIQGVSETPEFTVTDTGRFTIHTLVYDPATLDLSIVVPGETTGFDVNALLIQGGGDVCGALDVAGAPFDVITCGEVCEADAGTLTGNDFDCLEDSLTLTATVDQMPVVPDDFEVLYVLTSTDDLIIQGVSGTPEFTVIETGRFRIHTLVYNPATLDLSIVVPGETTGFDVNALLIQGGGDICASLDVNGAIFDVSSCDELVCEADAGSLTPKSGDCLDGHATLVAEVADEPVVPEGFKVAYLLTRGENLIIEEFGLFPQFNVTSTGTFRIHTLVYNPENFSFNQIVPGYTGAAHVLELLIQGGGDICGSLDVTGAKFEVEECKCIAAAGRLAPKEEQECVPSFGKGSISASFTQHAVIPEGYEAIFVLTEGDELVIRDVAVVPFFQLEHPGRYRIHTLVYNPTTLDLSIIKFGKTTGFDVNGLLIQGGGEICAALDVAGALFDVETCKCEADAGTLVPDQTDCLDGHATISAKVGHQPEVPKGFEIIYVLTKGDGLVIQDVSNSPQFNVDMTGTFRIHSLVYNPNTLDLGIVVPGKTTGFDVFGLLEDGGGDICGSLDVAGAKFVIEKCPCTADAGTAMTVNEADACLDGHATLLAKSNGDFKIPEGYELIYVLTSGDGLVIEAASSHPEFTVSETGRFTIHPFVYNPKTLDLGIIKLGVTTGFDVNELLIQGGGDICASLDVAGAPFDVKECPCTADAGTLDPRDIECQNNNHPVHLRADINKSPVVPDGYEVLYVLTEGDELVIQGTNDHPMFAVPYPGRFRIHTLVYNPKTLDLGIVVPGVTTGFDVNNLLIQGGGDICASLDVDGAVFDVVSCAAGHIAKAYPNPAHDHVTVTLQPTEGQGEVIVQIVDINGKLIREQQLPAGTEQVELNIAGLKKGTFFIQVNYGEGGFDTLPMSKY